MLQFPKLLTERLILRQPMSHDVPTLQKLINDKAIADTTLAIPYPYDLDMGHQWIKMVQERFNKDHGINFAIVLNDTGTFIGGIGLSYRLEYDSAELGYWIGQQFWGNGYATEAARAVVSFGFEQLGLNRIYASHFSRNPISGNVLHKIGMKHEGCLRQSIKKWGKCEDREMYGILREEWG